MQDLLNVSPVLPVRRKRQSKLQIKPFTSYTENTLGIVPFKDQVQRTVLLVKEIPDAIEDMIDLEEKIMAKFVKS